MKVMIKVLDANFLNFFFENKQKKSYTTQFKSIITTSTDQLKIGNTKTFFQQNSCIEMYKKV